MAAADARRGSLSLPFSDGVLDRAMTMVRAPSRSPDQGGRDCLTLGSTCRWAFIDYQPRAAAVRSLLRLASQRQRSPANVALVVAVVGARPRDSESRAFVRLPYLPAMRIGRGGIDNIAQHESLCDVESIPGERSIRNLTCSPEGQHPAESKRQLLR